MKWKAFLKRFIWYFVIVGGWLALVIGLIMLLDGCTFKIIVPNNFKTEHTFHIKMDYPTGLPFLTDTTTFKTFKVENDSTPFPIFLIDNAGKED